MCRKMLFLFMITAMAVSLAPFSAQSAPGAGEVGSQAADWTLNAYG